MTTGFIDFIRSSRRLRKLLAIITSVLFLLRAFFRYVARVFAFTIFEVTATLRMFVVV